MGLLSIFKTDQNAIATDPEVKKLVQYVAEMEAQLRLDWTRRLYGDGIYSGYKVLREFYKGAQWSYRKEGGGTMRTYNYCFTIVENMTAFLTNEPPQMSCPPKKQDDAVERVAAEGRTKLLDRIHRENDLPLVFQRSARVASINGDAYIFGAIPTFKVDDAGNRVFDSIRYWNIERPESVRVIWKDNNFAEMFGFIKHYRISVAMAKKLFEKEIAEAGIHVEKDIDMDDAANQEDRDLPMMTVKECWLENEYLLLFNNSNKPVHYNKHNWDYVPLHHIPNIHLPGEGKGTSDLENELDPQQEYNERASDLADIVREIAKPTYWGKDLDNLTEVRSGQTVIYQVGGDGVINAMPRSGETMPVETYLSDRKNDIIGLSGLNQVLYPGAHVMQATGRALSVIMQGVNNKIALRKEWWVKAFRGVNKGIMMHAEKYIDGADKLIAGNYQTDVFISSVLLRSVAEEINKFQAKVQSLTTTQQNCGISNPSEEQKLMKEELQDEILATEISKQPGLLHQVLAERAQMMNGNGGMSAIGAAGINGQNPAIASESDNNPAGNPANVTGAPSALSPEGAVRQMASRRGAPTQIPKK